MDCRTFLLLKSTASYKLTYIKPSMIYPPSFTDIQKKIITYEIPKH